MSDADLGLLAAAAQDIIAKIDFVLEDIEPDPTTGDRMAHIAFQGPDGPTRILLYRAGLAGMLMSPDEKVRHHLKSYGFDVGVVDGLEPAPNTPFASVMVYVTHESGTEEVRLLKFTRGENADIVKHFLTVVTQEDRDWIREGSKEEIREQILQDSAARHTEDVMGLTTPTIADFIAILRNLNPLVSGVAGKRRDKEDGAD